MLSKLKNTVQSLITFIIFISIYWGLKNFIVGPSLNNSGIPDSAFRDFIGTFIAIFVAAFIIGGLIGAIFWAGQKIGWIDQNAKFWLGE